MLTAQMQRCGQVDNITAGTSYTLSAYGGTHEPYYDHRYRLAFYNSSGTLLDFTKFKLIGMWMLFQQDKQF
jgi:hypothetical protein